MNQHFLRLPLCNALAALMALALVPKTQAQAPLQADPSWANRAGNPAGRAVAFAGDVNGDGLDDLLVGHPLVEGDRGRASLFLAHPDGPSMSADWSTTISGVGIRSDAHVGEAIAGAGDVNGDGFADVIVGAPRHTSAGIRTIGQGQVRVFYGSAQGLSNEADWTVLGPESPIEGESAAWLGLSVASAGDVNGDGFDDIVLGAYRAKVRVYLGSRSGLSTVPNAELDPIPGSWSEKVVAGVGDVNGDGYDDIAIGKPASEKAFVYLGGPDGVSETPAWTGAPNNTLTRLEYGCAVAGAGDVNGDGMADIIVGERWGATYWGAAYVYLGSRGGLATAPAWVASGPANFSDFGHAVAAAGDLNGDGYDDVLVGAPRDAGSRESSGEVFAYFGSATGLSSGIRVSQGPNVGAGYGRSLGRVGDVNGDGNPDLLVGGDLDAVLYLNTAPLPLPRELRQLDNQGQVIAPGSASTHVGFTAEALTPGRVGSYRLEIEVRLMSDPGATALTFTSAPVPAVTAARVGASGLQGGRSYRWSARILIQSGASSDWIPFGSDESTEIDVRTPNAMPAAQAVLRAADGGEVRGTVPRLYDRGLRFEATLTDRDPVDSCRLTVAILSVGRPVPLEFRAASAWVLQGSVVSIDFELPPGRYRWEYRAENPVDEAPEWKDGGEGVGEAADFELLANGSSAGAGCAASGSRAGGSAAIAFVVLLLLRRGRNP